MCDEKEVDGEVDRIRDEEDNVDADFGVDADEVVGSVIAVLEEMENVIFIPGRTAKTKELYVKYSTFLVRLACHVLMSNVDRSSQYE